MATLPREMVSRRGGEGEVQQSSSSAPAFNGSIELILGPMFSGKTTELFRRIRRYTFANYRCIVIKYRKDQRYAAAGEASTHDMLMLDAHPCERLSEAVDQVKDFDVVGIDEGQFFPDLPEFSEKWANSGKVVVVSALDGTFQRKPFGRTLELIPLAEKVDKLRAVCMLCFGDASFSKRISTTDNRVEVIGGSEAYVSTCRQCFLSAKTRPIKPLKHPGLFSPRGRRGARSHSLSSEVSSTSATASDGSTGAAYTPATTPEASPRSGPVNAEFPRPSPPTSSSLKSEGEDGERSPSAAGAAAAASDDKENLPRRSLNGAAAALLPLPPAFESSGTTASRSLGAEMCGKASRRGGHAGAGSSSGGVFSDVTSRMGKW